MAAAVAWGTLSVSADAASPSLVTRPAPQFTVNTSKSLQQYRGQPVVVIVAPSPRSRAFRKQVKRLEQDYARFAARKALFVAAFTNNPTDEAPRSSIPFLYARDGAALAQHYGANPTFTLIVVGKDGNLDLITSKVVGSRKAFDAIVNNGTLQSEERRAL